MADTPTFGRYTEMPVTMNFYAVPASGSGTPRH
jgi:hypothetical protein